MIMADLGTRNPEFDIEVSLNGQQKNIHVKPDETSDGVEYFICFDDENELTQIRLETEGNWEQMWGELSKTDVDAIGEAITKQTKDGNS
jgi:hypothetical protein